MAPASTAFTDEFFTPLSPPGSPSTPAASPSKRSTRSTGNHNRVRYLGFERTLSSKRSPTTIQYRIGDVVLVSPDLKVLPNWLKEPVTGSNSRAKAKLKKLQDGFWWEGHDDGLSRNVKVAVVESLYEDERGEKMGTFRWLVRPKYVWDSKKGPGDEGQDVHEQELYYSHDSQHASRSSKSQKDYQPKTTDHIPIRFLLPALPVTVLSSSSFFARPDAEKVKGKVFFVRQVYDVRPIANGGEEEWFYDVEDFEAIWKECLSRGCWDIDVGTEEEQPDEVVEVKSPSKGTKKRRMQDRTYETPKKRRRVEIEPLGDVVSSSDSSEGSSDDYEDSTSESEEEDSDDADSVVSARASESSDVEMGEPDWFSMSTPTKSRSPSKRSPNKRSPTKRKRPTGGVKLQGGLAAKKRREALAQRREERKARRVSVLLCLTLCSDLRPMTD
ncbi:hypothetical protein BT69DRAFT_199265 [Atractiella rhizophila]|nr:hypothetical protein BT69DRAFT_199265 [Atractiella rhizophila]